MEQKINKIYSKHTDEYISFVLDNYKQKINDSAMSTTELKEILCSFKKLEITKSDLDKKTRVRNTISDNDRCNAMRANRTQCTRRRRDGSCFCGTHIKGAPNGTMPDSSNTESSNIQTIAIYTQEINGIYYYIDDNSNIYKSEDILNKILKPSIIGSYGTKQQDDKIVYFRIT